MTSAQSFSETINNAIDAMALPWPSWSWHPVESVNNGGILTSKELYVWLYSPDMPNRAASTFNVLLNVHHSNEQVEVLVRPKDGLSAYCRAVASATDCSVKLAGSTVEIDLDAQTMEKINYAYKVAEMISSHLQSRIAHAKAPINAAAGQ